MLSPIYSNNFSTLPDELAIHITKPIKQSTIENLKAFNNIVRVESESDSTMFIDGGYTDIVLQNALKQIVDTESLPFTLKVIEIFRLEEYFSDLENNVKKNYETKGAHS